MARVGPVTVFIKPTPVNHLPTVIPVSRFTLHEGAFKSRSSQRVVALSNSYLLGGVRQSVIHIRLSFVR